VRLDLTADQLAALAIALDVPGIPGVRSPLLEDGPPELAEALLLTLEASGHVIRDGSQLVVDPDLALLLVPLLEGECWVVERAEQDTSTTTIVCRLDDVVVVHTRSGALHTLRLAEDLGKALLGLVDASDAEAESRPGVRAARSRLLDRPGLATTVGSWRATSTLQRLSAPGVVEKVGVIDGGPGRVWWVILDPDTDDALEDDPTLQAVPVGPYALQARLTDWAAAAVH